MTLLQLYIMYSIIDIPVFIIILVCIKFGFSRLSFSFYYSIHILFSSSSYTVFSMLFEFCFCAVLSPFRFTCFDEQSCRDVITVIES